MDAVDELLIKLLNIWFYKEQPESSVSDSLKRFASEIIKATQYGDDKIFSHPKINEILLLLKDYGIIEYHKSIMEIYFEGRMRLQTEIREMMNDPQVSETMTALANVLGNLTKKFSKEAKKQIEEEKNLSAIPYLTSRSIPKN